MSGGRAPRVPGDDLDPRDMVAQLTDEERDGSAESGQSDLPPDDGPAGTEVGESAGAGAARDRSVTPVPRDAPDGA